MHARLILSAAGLAAAAAATVSAANGARSDVAAGTVIDRTLLCETGIRGGIHKLQVIASSSIREGPQKHEANIAITTRVDPFRLAGIGENWLDFSPKCRRSATTVALTSRGLSGGAASVFEDEYGCPVPTKVLVRVRGVFYERVSLVLSALIPGLRTWHALGYVKEGAIAVRTLGAKRVAYVTVAATGKARIFTRGSCG